MVKVELDKKTGIGRSSSNSAVGYGGEGTASIAIDAVRASPHPTVLGMNHDNRNRAD